jgi:hypothetical protein
VVEVEVPAFEGGRLFQALVTAQDLFASPFGPAVPPSGKGAGNGLGGPTPSGTGEGAASPTAASAETALSPGNPAPFSGETQRPGQGQALLEALAGAGAVAAGPRAGAKSSPAATTPSSSPAAASASALAAPAPAGILVAGPDAGAAPTV